MGTQLWKQKIYRSTNLALAGICSHKNLFVQKLSLNVRLTKRFQFRVRYLVSKFELNPGDAREYQRNQWRVQTKHKGGC